jgi:hypothetical protein
MDNEVYHCKKAQASPTKKRNKLKPETKQPRPPNKKKSFARYSISSTDQNLQHRKSTKLKEKERPYERR